MAKRHALNFFHRHGDLRRALPELADAYSSSCLKEPCAAKLRDAVETLDFTDPVDAYDVFEDTDPWITAFAVSVLVALVANELGWGRKEEWQRN
jgi:hypothetical protein